MLVLVGYVVVVETSEAAGSGRGVLILLPQTPNPRPYHPDRWNHRRSSHSADGRCSLRALHQAHAEHQDGQGTPLLSSDAALRFQEG